MTASRGQEEGRPAPDGGDAVDDDEEDCGVRSCQRFRQKVKRGGEEGRTSRARGEGGGVGRHLADVKGGAAVGVAGIGHVELEHSLTHVLNNILVSDTPVALE